MGREKGGGPEVVSAESFQAMKQGMGCEDCQKQRLFLGGNSEKKNKSRRNRKQKPQKVISGSPVLIRLKETLSNDGYTSSSSSSGRGSVDSSSQSDTESSSPRQGRHQYSSNKTLSKLIRLWEKENSKRSRRDYRNIAAIPRLNNTRGRLFRAAEGPRLQYIWNNLNGDSSDNESQVSSLSSSTSLEDYWSDNETCDSKDLDYRELHHLAQWAAGPPLVRYSCGPRECLECQSLLHTGLPLVTHFPAQGQPCLWPECSSQESYNLSPRDSPVSFGDDDVASSESGVDTLSIHSGDSSEDDDAFVIDLTGMDVQISVDYQEEDSFLTPYNQLIAPHAVRPYAVGTQCPMPYMAPVYSPMPYLPAAYGAPPFVPHAVAPLYGIPTWPAYVPWVLSGHEDTQDLPQTAFVPPSELEYCEYLVM